MAKPRAQKLRIPCPTERVTARNTEDTSAARLAAMGIVLETHRAPAAIIAVCYGLAVKTPTVRLAINLKAANAVLLGAKTRQEGLAEYMSGSELELLACIGRMAIPDRVKRTIHNLFDIEARMQFAGVFGPMYARRRQRYNDRLTPTQQGETACQK